MGAGKYIITLTNDENENYTGSSDTREFTIEKANSSYKGIYKVLNNELAKVCCSEYEFLLNKDLKLNDIKIEEYKFVKKMNN